MYLTQTIHLASTLHPQRAMTVCADRSTTAKESIERIARFAGGLRDLGIEPGDRVGILALNSDHYHEVLLAVPWAGAVVNPVNTRWSVHEIAYSLADCGTRVLIVDNAFSGMVPALVEQVGCLRTIIYTGDERTPDGAVSYEELISDSGAIDDARRGGSDLFGVFYTGGTTGRPKGVMLSHDNLLTSSMGSMITTDLLTRGGVLLHAAPMFHLADLLTWSIGLLTGSTHVMIPSFTPAGVVDAVAGLGVTDALLVPTMVQMLVDSPEAAEADLASLRNVVYGGSSISAAVLMRARDRLGDVSFTQAYGMTELAPVATLLSSADHDDPELIRSAGRPAAHSEVRIVDSEDREVLRGEIGEIVVRGGHVMQGYWNQPEETAATLRSGWMHTGDGGYMDERGYVFVVDRIKDMIVTGGENVYSAEVENAVAQHPSVLQCAVIGIPDDRWGERVHAVVTVAAGASLTVEELGGHCRSMLANYKIPRSLAIVSELPISAAGKILKRELRAPYWERQDRAVN